MKITCLSLYHSISKNPCGSRRQNAQTFKQRSILHDASTRKPFPESLRVYPPKLRANSENGLRLRCEIQCILGLMKIEPVHAKAVVEEDSLPAHPIRNETVKTPIETGWKGRIFFV